MPNPRAKKLDPEALEIENEWKKKGDLAASVLDFRRRAAEALDMALAATIRSGEVAGGTDFTTKSGRACRVMIFIGDEAVAAIDRVLPDKA